MKKRIKIQGFLIFSAIVLSILLSKHLFSNWRIEALDGFLDLLGMVILLFGFLFRIAARGYKIEKSGEGKKLIVEGPYKLMRNPMYFGTFLIGLGVNLVIFQWWVFFLFLAVSLLIYLPQVRQEENILLERFGEEYRNYCKTTPRYSFSIFWLFKKELRKHLFFKWRWVKKEWVGLAGIVGLVVFAEIYKDAGLFGARGRLKEIWGFVITIAIAAAIISVLFYEKENFKRTV